MPQSLHEQALVQLIMELDEEWLHKSRIRYPVQHIEAYTTAPFEYLSF
jgi:hypothetical protein